MRISQYNACQLTVVEVLTDQILDLASVHLLHALRLERISVLATVEHAVGVHGTLERVTLPAEDVVGVLSVASAAMFSINA